MIVDFIYKNIDFVLSHTIPIQYICANNKHTETQDIMTIYQKIILILLFPAFVAAHAQTAKVEVAWTEKMPGIWNLTAGKPEKLNLLSELHTMLLKEYPHSGL